jgi:hypothetical protein
MVASDVRLPRVAASVALTVALALIVLPGTVGSQSPRPTPPIDARLLQPVEFALPDNGTTMAAPTLDPAHRSRGALDSGDRLVDPAAAPRAPQRVAVDSPAVDPVVVAVATPTPRPTPAPIRSTARSQESGGSGSSGGSGDSGSSDAGASSGGGSTGGGASTTDGGGWNYDPDVSWYGPGLYGNGTACGQTYTPTIHGVAHKTLPCGTMITFRNPANGATITVPVIDRGPYVAGRNWDLSAATCAALDHCYTGPIQWR